MMCVVTTALYAVASVSALLGAVIGALLNGRASRRTLERQLTHEDARARAERFLDTRRDLYVRILANHQQLRDGRRADARIEDQRAELSPLPDDPDKALADIKGNSDREEARKTAEQLVSLMKRHEALNSEAKANESIMLASAKTSMAHYGELTLVAPRYVQRAFMPIDVNAGDLDLLGTFIQAARWDLEGHKPTKAELAALDLRVPN